MTKVIAEGYSRAHHLRGYCRRKHKWSGRRDGAEVLEPRRRACSFVSEVAGHVAVRGENDFGPNSLLFAVEADMSRFALSGPR